MLRWFKQVAAGQGACVVPGLMFQKTCHVQQTVSYQSLLLFDDKPNMHAAGTLCTKAATEAKFGDVQHDLQTQLDRHTSQLALLLISTSIALCPPGSAYKQQHILLLRTTAVRRSCILVAGQGACLRASNPGSLGCQLSS